MECLYSLHLIRGFYLAKGKINEILKMKRRFKSLEEFDLLYCEVRNEL